MHIVAGDGVAGIKRHRRDVSSDDVRNFTTASGGGRPKEDLESSTWRHHHKYDKAMDLGEAIRGVVHDSGVVKLRVEVLTTTTHRVFSAAAWGRSISSLCYLFRNPFSSTTMGDANPIYTLGDYFKPSHEGYMNTIELPVGNNVDPNQHLKDFLKLVDSLDLDDKNRERTRLRLFQFSLRDQASNCLERLLAGSITTWEDLTTRFLAQFFPPGRTAKLRNDILMFQQHHEESLSEAWTRFKDLLQKVPHHGIDLWLQKIFGMPVPIHAHPTTMLDRTDLILHNALVLFLSGEKIMEENLMKSDYTEGPFQIGNVLQTPAKDALRNWGALH
ncbi:zinc finger, CCHC-type containing protein [Tanacetum coccineum]